jgi:selenide, water dikinase
VVGLVAPDALVRNSTAKPGDALVLTKPLGTGVIATAVKRGAADESSLRAAVESMTTLNRGAAEAMLEVGVHAATDVTGFGLLGHLQEVARASRIAARVRAGSVPLLPGALAAAEAGHIAGGTKRNREDLRDHLHWSDAVPEPVRWLLCDAQTSGGLLIAVPAERASALLDALKRASTPAATVIGELVEGEAGRIEVEA